MKIDESRLLSIERAAEWMGLRPPTLRLWIAQRKIGSVKLGRRRLIKVTEIERVIERSTIPAAPERPAR
jgi:excisionase family DNA binding protein